MHVPRTYAIEAYMHTKEPYKSLEETSLEELLRHVLCLYNML